MLEAIKLSDELRPAAARPVFDEAVFGDLRELVGGAGLASFLERFDAQLDQSFRALPASDADLAALKFEAHALASISGMLGFSRLSHACVELETACDLRYGATPAGAIPLFAMALGARDEARAAAAKVRARV